METGGAEDRVIAQRWVFALTVACLYIAAVLRSVLAFEGGQRGLALILLGAWLLLLLTEPRLSSRWPAYFVLCVGLQTAIVVALLPMSDASDFFAILLAVPSMQAMQRWQPRPAAILITLFAALTGVALRNEFGLAQALAFALMYAAVNVFLASLALAMKRATEARLGNEALALELRAANRRLADYAQRAERLAGARERQRLARDLHDSVTQTLFSMTLTARSALLLLGRDSSQVGTQLDQLDELAYGALVEMGVLSAEIPPTALAQDTLIVTLQRHLSDRERRDGLSVSLEVDGDERLPPPEEQAVLRILQEALNNVVKHAGVSHAVVRLRLRPPFRLEVADEGRGFDPEHAEGRGDGLTSMKERAAEMGWSLTVGSAPGAGTRVVAERTVSEGGRSRGGD